MRTTCFLGVIKKGPLKQPLKVVGATKKERESSVAPVQVKR